MHLLYIMVEKSFSIMQSQKHININSKLIIYNVFSLFLKGWASADAIATRFLPLWVGARGTEFDWKYIQSGFIANFNLVSDL